MKKVWQLICAAVLSIAFSYPSDACTRVIYKGPNNTIFTARSMDWKDDIDPNIWVFPRGIQRSGEVGEASVKWTSKYGSVVVSAFDLATTDGMNEKGLVSNMLWLLESEYPQYNPNGKQKGISLALWGQYMLDNYASVAQAVEDLKKNPIVVVTAETPGRSTLAKIHLSISDATGDSAILEFMDGKLNIFHSPDYTVLTNSPRFEEQLAVNNYWQGLPLNKVIPGSGRSEDRFVRADYYSKAVVQSDDTKIALGAAFSVIRNCSVPYGVHIDGEPNLSSTKWRAVADQKNLVYYYEDPLSLTPLWLDLKTLDFSATASIQKLDVSKSQVYMGLSNDKLEKSKGFDFMGIKY